MSQAWNSRQHHFHYTPLVGFVMNLHLDSRGRNTDPTLGGRDVYVTMKKEYLGWDTLLDTAILGTYNLLHCPNFYRNALGSWIYICKKKKKSKPQRTFFSFPPTLPPSPLSFLPFSYKQPHGLQPTRLLCPWDFPGNSTGVDSHFLLQRIFPTQR